MRWQKQVAEQRITSLLTKVTEHVSSDIDLRPQVQQRLAALHQRRSIQSSGQSSDRLSGTRTLAQRRFAPRWGYLMSSALVIIGLLLSAFTFARPLIFSWMGDNGLHGIALQNASLINRSATSQGITLQVEQVYADAARTALTLRIQAPANYKLVAPRLDMVYLLDSQGHRYSALTGLQVANEGLIEFAPLPLDALTSEQSLTFVVQVMLPGGGRPSIAGPWQIPFQVHPQTAHATMLTAPPVTQSGVTIQPERLDVSSAGARLVMRISGLAADTTLSDAAFFARHNGDTIVGCPPNSGTCATSGSTTDGGALLRLKSADGQVLEPSWALATEPATPDLAMFPTAGQLVGPSGVAELEILFFTPLHDAHGPIQMTIDHLSLKSSHVDASGNEQVASGPWTFTLL